MNERKRFKQTSSLRERLIDFAESARAQAAALPPGPDQDTLLKKALSAEKTLQLGVGGRTGHSTGVQRIAVSLWFRI
jgi:hypothetical protein